MLESFDAPHIGEAALVTAGLAAGAYAYAGRWPTSQLFGSTLLGGSDWQELALTFDDGPNERYTQEVLELLAMHRVRATFFLVGEYVRQVPYLAREIQAAGHLIGNHTMHHRNLMYLAPARVRQEMQECTAALEDVLGAKVEYFRPPKGARRPDVLRAARELGMVPVLWNAAGYDWRKPSPEAIYRHLHRGMERNKRRGRASTLLLHDGGPGGLGQDRGRTVAALPLVIVRSRRAGYRFVTVDTWK